MVSTADTTLHVVDPKNPGAVDEIAYYIPNMNFQDIEARRQKVLARILELAQEVNGKQGS
ncbi:hypothetical protein [Desulfofundulus thermocisternus]|uniref:hypothetical protein n=1 Tax=Desulfofundulus thermocisternus TaxID=42471 RepID=UPI00217DDE22|nr:hypothetical protein [Desulfofundulus thermocisternus]